MNHHFVKFVLLITVIIAVLFSRIAYPTVSTAEGGRPSAASANLLSQKVPLFVLPSVAVSADAGGDDESADVSTNTNEPIIAKPAPQTSVLSNAAPATHGIASLVADLETGARYEGANTGKRWPIASLTKLMSATIVVDRLDPTIKIIVTEAMFAADPTEQTLVVGGTYSVTDLLRAMLLPSSNVAAETLAAFYGRGRFIDEMNARAASWGMANTYFGDPSGISATSQSTADDLLKLAQRVYANYPAVFQATKTAQVSITEQNSGKTLLIKSTNNFAGSTDFLGGKTGYTNEASGNLLSMFTYHGQPLFIVVLGTDDRFGDTQKLYDWYKTK